MSAQNNNDDKSAGWIEIFYKILYTLLLLLTWDELNMKYMPNVYFIK